MKTPIQNCKYLIILLISLFLVNCAERNKADGIVTDLTEECIEALTDETLACFGEMENQTCPKDVNKIPICYKVTYQNPPRECAGSPIPPHGQICHDHCTVCGGSEALCNSCFN